MAKFRSSSVVEPVSAAESIEDREAEDGVLDRSIGSIISELRDLSTDQVEQILTYQQQHGVRFGEAAVALGLVSNDDVLQALSQQFHYPYAPKRADNQELVTLTQPFSVQAEAFRAIRSQITMRLNHEGEQRKALAIISPDTMDGKSFFAANLAVAMAQLGSRTLLVDADMRGPRQHQIFEVSNKTGLSSVLSGRTSTQVIQQVEGVPGLFVMPVGVTPPNPLELVERPAFGLLMRELVSKFDYVLVDTPAAQYGADASVIAARCGAALVLARNNESRVADLVDLVGSFENCPVRITGVVMNEF
ncbi:MAG: polysaccharide biosynthesis tyrosine autokinase [Burkholderiaceae bacterium]|nr:polysaccharide biosynthesis tyrosine autokinase [Burkholderiaceae bacterium]